MEPASPPSAPDAVEVGVVRLRPMMRSDLPTHRWTEYGGEDVDGPIIREEIDVPTGSIAYVVAPNSGARDWGAQ